MSDEKVSGNAPEFDRLMELADWAKEELHPDLQAWVEENGPFGHPMLRHPLVYDMVLAVPGQTNRAYEHKRKLLAEAQAESDWHTVVFLHERPYRFKALLDYVTGHYDDEEGAPICLDDLPPLSLTGDLLALVADVWVDSENIQQNVAEWRALIGEARTFWLGTPQERAEFDALPDPIPAWRGGSVGDWSWTTDETVAQFFAKRSGHPVRHALIPKADCFGYLTRRSEAELLVRLTDERYSLVYPDGAG